MLPLQFPGRALLVVLGSFVLAVRSFVPATPTNATQDWNTTLQGLLDVFWYPDGSPDPVTLQSVAVANVDSIWATGPIMHFSEDDGLNVTASSFNFAPWIALVACDSNSTKSSESQTDIVVRAKGLNAQAAILYSNHSETCVLLPGYTRWSSGIPVYVITSDDARTLDGFFKNINATRYGSFDSKTLDSESSNIFNWENSDPRPDPGYLMVTIINNSSLFGGNGTDRTNETVAISAPPSSFLLAYLVLGLGILGAFL
ncbi:hypothetical protein DICSQDRAFT_168556 [Dichomitus squalens LYAD-421 SS1]|uniref:uncharacterized protein n=1 Tax=Dichomitus squalens (strain LYAD-421) TaxID=732165 RepID=UPI0004411D5B|nr:uncharacterized protein DICSQDRAFT_168556 [Dichomitus squalens LYAD-421 SS1]EJF62882.1 hypothetical protein DICSQDRAFT_168556 [Dichomitus squalens LYAD-421 SS1]